MLIVRGGFRFVLCGFLCVGQALADEGVDERATSQLNADALPGLFRLPSSRLTAGRFGLATQLGYGWTESQYSGDSSHHRAAGTLAVGYSPFDFVALAVRGSYRSDFHSNDVDGSDGGTTLDVLPTLRTAAAFSESWGAGVDLKAHVLGAANSGGASTPSVEAKVFSDVDLSDAWSVTLAAGYRTGQSGEAVDDWVRYSRGDRVGLGLSEFASIPVGLGVLASSGKVEGYLEGSWSPTLGKDAPSASDWPLFLTLGGRYRVSPVLNLWTSIDVLASSTPGTAADDSVMPIGPRASVYFGASWSWAPGFEKAPRSPSAAKPFERKEKKKKEEKTVKKERKNVEEAKVSPVVLTSAVVVRVVDHTGHPISDAEVKLIHEGGAETLTIPLSERNVYSQKEIPVGRVRLVVSADLLQSTQRYLELEHGDVTDVEITLQKELSTKGMLRGLIRSYDGLGVQARVSVVPQGAATSEAGTKRAQTTETGEFELTLPPGKYEVIIEANGFLTQRRKVVIPREWVTVLNADLRKDPS